MHFKHCKYDGKLICIRHFLLLDKVTFDEDINVLEKSLKGYVSDIFTKPLWLPFQNIKVLKV